MIRKTITSIFMVPTLKIPREGLLGNGFINGYSADVNHIIQYTDAVYILFKPNNIDKFRRFLEDEYERTKMIIEDYDCDDGYVIVVYKLDPKFKEDFNLIRDGKYSQTSKEFQKLFPPVIKIVRNGLPKDELSLQCRIFAKSPDLVEFWETEFDVQFDEQQEVWRGWNEKEEILDISKIKSYVE